MSRTIKFRGFNRKDNKWFYGNLSQFDGGGCVINDIAVDPDTVGQFTGLLDKNGKEIYEGDEVVLYSNYRGKKKRKTPKAMQGVVVWSLCGLRIKIKDYPEAPWNHKLIQQPQQIEVFGNIHHPELLNEK